MEIYLCTNPAWPDWTKVGVTNTDNKKKRLNAYQTSSPLRDYKFEVSIPCDYASDVEKCLIYHYNGLNSETEWINKPYSEVLIKLHQFRERVLQDPSAAKKWLFEQEETIKSDTTKYVDYSHNKKSIKNLFALTSYEGIKQILKENNIEGVKLNDIPLNEYMTSTHISKLLGLGPSKGSHVHWWGTSKKYGIISISKKEYDDKFSQ